MNSILASENKFLDIYKNQDWLHLNVDSAKIQTPFQVQYAFQGLDIPVQKEDTLSFIHCGVYKCVSCQKTIKKLYSGYCYVCLTKKASADMCVMSPHNCHFLKGTCREPQWGLRFCYEPHYVYLAFTDKFKVGITRQQQILTRWVDQGATMAAPICLVSSRHQAGTIEKTLTEILPDRSHWQNMLKLGNYRPSTDEFWTKFNSVLLWLKNTLNQKPEIIVSLPNEANVAMKENVILLENPTVVEINFPISESLEKIKSISLEKEKEVRGKITGIKGQYLFFGERVMNVRSHEGYVVDFESY